MTAEPTTSLLPTGDEAPYWAAAAEDRLELPFCLQCQRHYWPAADRCVHCLSTEVTWRACSGMGTLYSYVVYHHAYSEALAQEVPYNVAIVELAEGPRLVTRIVGLAPGDLRVGLRVQVAFETLRGVRAPVFRPSNASSPGPGA